MSKMNDGTSILAAGLATAACALLGSQLWARDHAALMPALLVVLPALGALWLLVGHARKIGVEREESERALSGLRDALDAGAKTFAVELAAAGAAWRESRDQSLIEVKREVSEPIAGLQQAWQTTSASQQESFAKHFQEVAAAVHAGRKEDSDAWEVRHRSLSESIRSEHEEWARQTRAVMENLTGNFQDLANNLRVSLAAWKEEAEAREIRSRNLAGEIRREHGEWTQQAQASAALMNERAEHHLQAFAVLSEEMRAAWTATAAQTEAAWERRGRMLQEQSAGAQAALARELDEARKMAFSEAGRHLHTIVRAGEELRAAWTADAAQTGAAWERRAQALQEQAAEAEAALARELGEARKLAFADAARILEMQGQSSVELEGKAAKLAEQALQSSHDLKEIAHLSRVNQTEMQAGVGMLNAGLASLLERLERQSEAGHEQQALLAELGRGLSAFEERAAEILVENAMKTQEILMDVLPLAGHKRETEPGHSESERVAA